MKYYLILLTILMSTLSFAGSKKGPSLKVIELREMYVDFMRYTSAQEPFMTNLGFIPTHRLDLHTNMDLFNKIGFFDTMVHSQTDQTQYRKVGLRYRVGAHITSWADVYFDHFSQHILDAVPASANTYDAVGVRIHLYQEKK